MTKWRPHPSRRSTEERGEKQRSGSSRVGQRLPVAIWGVRQRRLDPWADRGGPVSAEASGRGRAVNLLPHPPHTERRAEYGYPGDGVKNAARNVRGPRQFHSAPGGKNRHGRGTPPRGMRGGPSLQQEP
ncbi:hypothetical protein NDU88_002464 [Pleurodeles waltl]|uniref:Uncharacterized protein n=1 Tax=Pleurodeles waltl TaxID=8319 RepID=A0AAV7WQR4_PLEWA|nr:hypothetical protein NDU88_002464 [Pleurodeles waltl]